MIQMTGNNDINKFIFGDMLDLIAFLKENGIEEDPISIDADDLQTIPSLFFENIAKLLLFHIAIVYFNGRLVMK